MATLNVVGYTQTEGGSWVKVNGALTYSVSSTETSYTITLTSITSGTSSTSFTTYFKIVAGGTQIARVSFSSTGIKTINVSGSKTIQKSHAEQTVALTMTNELACKSNSFSSGQGPSATANLGVPPKTSYIVSYDTQGGSSVFSQTKWHDEDITLQTAPSKNGYLFDTWVDSDGNEYAPKSTYSLNAALSLTAKYYQYGTFMQWSRPITAYRCQYSTPNVVDDEGTSCAIHYTVAYDYEMKTAKNTTIKVRAIAYRNSWDTTPFYTGSYTTITQSADSRFYNGTYLLGSSTTVFDTDAAYHIVLELQTSFSGGSYTDTRNLKLEAAFFTMDVLSGGHGIAFGGPARDYYGDGTNGGRGWMLNYFRTAFMDDVIFKSMVGTVQMFAGETPPRGWLICDGRYVNKFLYPALYDVLGDTWGPTIGSGDNFMFALPDFRGRAPVGVMPLDSYSSTYPNLLRDEGENWNPSAYNAYILKASANLSTSTQYTIQLWDVDVFHSGKSTAATTNVSVYWGGGSVSLVKFICDGTASAESTSTVNSYICNFVEESNGTGGTLYHADYLEAVFTTGSTAGASPSTVFVYNSVANVSGSMYLKIGKWQLTAGSNSKIKWTAPAYWYDKNKRKLLGSYGGTDEKHISPDQIPAHTHGLNDHKHSISHQHGFGFASGQSIVTSNKGISEHKVTAGDTSSATYLYSDGDVQTSGKTATTTITTSTSGGNSGNTTSSGSDWNFSVMQPYAAVNFIICTGVWLDPELGVIIDF